MAYLGMLYHFWVFDKRRREPKILTSKEGGGNSKVAGFTIFSILLEKSNRELVI